MIDVAALRLRAQCLVASKLDDPRDAVAWFGAVQAQDYRGALWGIGQRLRSATEADVEKAIAARTIVRTWPMRNTLHFVAADDVRWILKLLAPRALARAAGRQRQLGLDEKTFAASRACFEKLLAGGKDMTRPEAYAALEAAKISASDQRGIHVLGHLAMQRVLCFGAHRGKQPTFVLLDEWLPKTRAIEGDEALGEIATRYFTSHGPASVHDFAWWTGLALGEARRAVEIAKPNLTEHTVDGRTTLVGSAKASRSATARSTHLLPAFDEYTVAYRERVDVLEPRHAPKLGNLLSPVIEIDGRIVGTWRRSLVKGRVVVEATPFKTLAAADRVALEEAVARYGEFLGAPATLASHRAARRVTGSRS